MGARRAMKAVAAFAAAVICAGGCASAGSDRAVTDKDRQRIDVAKRMPGSDIPVDPADLGDAAQDPGSRD